MSKNEVFGLFKKIGSKDFLETAHINGTKLLAKTACSGKIFFSRY